ncbi:uncharacterized protein PHALS_15395 [Plasmopara halstedii]|uniref:Uncharacterized protein n=1 Tax=Plasmopara halstedii TaxID=4781 RepID=A0A0P1AFE8_PLAHL|nr:uncharacterized protein PHALS_15395 [Plasmopara halstedii]CEG39598.1 hypothetical protein PHALS_15395 [Plasmopara halstedii]|eukprot:XP_024575967.1 hypothetical protein PHALS_15395 [Plasmopara halstedii]
MWKPVCRTIHMPTNLKTDYLLRQRLTAISLNSFVSKSAAARRRKFCATRAALTKLSITDTNW